MPLAMAWARQKQAAQEQLQSAQKRRCLEEGQAAERAKANTAEVDALFPSQAATFCRSGPAVTAPTAERHGVVRVWSCFR